MSDVGEESEFEGVYVAHWEVARFAILRGHRFFGLVPRIDKWLAFFPPAFAFPDVDAHNRAGPARFYRMRVRGRLGPKGHYGHKGICDRELHVSEVITCEETRQPGPIW